MGGLDDFEATAKHLTGLVRNQYSKIADQCAKEVERGSDPIQRQCLAKVLRGLEEVKRLPGVISANLKGAGIIQVDQLMNAWVEALDRIVPEDLPASSAVADDQANALLKGIIQTLRTASPVG